MEAAKLGAKLVLTARNKTLLEEIKQKCLGISIRVDPIFRPAVNLPKNQVHIDYYFELRKPL